MEEHKTRMEIEFECFKDLVFIERVIGLAADHREAVEFAGALLTVGRRRIDAVSWTRDGRVWTATRKGRDRMKLESEPAPASRDLKPGRP